MNHEEISRAIDSLQPNAKWSLSGTTITWESGTQPTNDELEAENTRLKALDVSNKYKLDRAAAYPSIGEQLDMQYWDKKNGTTTWVDAVAKVKSDNPKP